MKRIIIVMAALAGLTLAATPVLQAGPSAEVKFETKAPQVSINKATPQELEALQGVGPAIADRIVKYRQEHGAFQKVEDLSQVPGIGEGKLQKMKNQITL